MKSIFLSLVLVAIVVFPGHSSAGSFEAEKEAVAAAISWLSLYKRDFNKSHGVGLADAILAATAENEKAELKTLNVKHYPMISGLKPAYKK